MEVKKQFTVLVVLVAMVVFVGLSGCTNSAKGPKVGIIQLAEHAALDAASEGFIAELKDNGYVDGENITIDLQNAQGEQANLSTISDRFVSEEVDLILAVATPAAQAVAGKTSTIPILGTAITDYVEARLALSNRGNLNISGPPYESSKNNWTCANLLLRAKTVGVSNFNEQFNSQARIWENIESLDQVGSNCLVPMKFLRRPNPFGKIHYHLYPPIALATCADGMV